MLHTQPIVLTLYDQPDFVGPERSMWTPGLNHCVTFLNGPFDVRSAQTFQAVCYLFTFVPIPFVIYFVPDLTGDHRVPGCKEPPVLRVAGDEPNTGLIRVQSVFCIHT